jgi:hypothetical protein
MYIGKLLSGKFVVVRAYAERVEFSDQQGWVCIDTDVSVNPKAATSKWVEASTPFEWVRRFNFGEGR